MNLDPLRFDLAALTTNDLAAVVESDRPVVVLLPVGSVEPHGPHLSLVTDTVISRSAAFRAAALLNERGVAAWVAPDVPYGVTECAAAFTGAVTVSPEALSTFLRSVVDGFIANGVSHVCLVNNHLEPAHDHAVRRSIEGLELRTASVACPLAKRWARTLSSEFRGGACHAGKYETSIMLAASPGLVREDVRAGLPGVRVSLSEKLRSGVTDFVKMGLEDAYAGDPAEATAQHGHEQLDKLAHMIATEVLEALGV